MRPSDVTDSNFLDLFSIAIQRMYLLSVLLYDFVRVFPNYRKRFNSQPESSLDKRSIDRVSIIVRLMAVEFS